jgi:exodeoxyribonuclease VII small subunit
LSVAAKKEPGFETSLKRLEDIVTKLEGDELSLEESLKLFEEGMKLAQSCGARLEEAEKKVNLLIKEPGAELEQVPFELTPEEDGGA